MDHRISKDMISSGMIPSGEKNQEDLGKTQYGTVPSPDALLDVYKKMYETKEEVINEHHKKDADGNTIPHEGEEVNEAVPLLAKAALGAIKTIVKKPMVKKIAKDVATGAAMSAGSNLMSGGGGGQQQQKQKAATVSASADLFDIVKGQLLDEGYNEREINEIMVNLTEEQLEEFITALTKKVATGAAQYGSNLGKYRGRGVPAPKQGPVASARMQENPPKPSSQYSSPVVKPGSTGFKASSPSEVVKDVNLRKKEAATAKAKPLRDKMDSALTQLRAGSLKFGSTSQSEKPLKNRTINKKFGEENVDLFDIVKVQLLDEGLSEEEIIDIMLTLTPDEIMSEMAVNPNIAAMDAKNKANMIARAQANKTPDKVKEASKRQYTAGGPKDTGANKYTTQDKKTIIDYNKDK